MGEIKGRKDDAAASPASHGNNIADQRAARRTRPWDEENGTPAEDEAKPEHEWSHGRGNTAASSASARVSTTFAALDIYHDLSEVTGRSTDRSNADPPGRYRVLAIHASAVVLGLATWFSATAVSAQLKERWGIGDTASGLLTSSVNIGFVVGAVLQAVLNMADLVRPQVLYFAGCVGAAVWNALVAAPVNFPVAVILRFLTGASLSLVYPPSLKLISTWFKYGRGVALGTIIGGLSLGSALPHLIVGAGGVGDRWRIVTYSTSILALISGVIVLAFVPTGPFPFSKAKFSLQTIPRLAGNRGVVLATLAYCAHMWELYGLWTWFLSLYTDYLEVQEEDGLGGGTNDLSRKRLASLVTFGVVGIGGIGCLFIGWIGCEQRANAFRDRAALVDKSKSSFANLQNRDWHCTSGELQKYANKYEAGVPGSRSRKGSIEHWFVENARNLTCQPPKLPEREYPARFNTRPTTNVPAAADAKIGRCNASITALAVSGSCAAAYGPLSGAGAPQGLLIPLALLWGSAAVAESAQFSAMATELSDQDTVGTALTLQMALGFTVTVVGIFAIPLVEEATSWGWTTVFLVPGPLLGIGLIVALKLSPCAAKMSNGKG